MFSEVGLYRLHLCRSEGRSARNASMTSCRREWSKGKRSSRRLGRSACKRAIRAPTSPSSSLLLPSHRRSSTSFRTAACVLLGCSRVQPEKAAQGPRYKWLRVPLRYPGRQLAIRSKFAERGTNKSLNRSVKTYRRSGASVLFVRQGIRTLDRQEHLDRKTWL